MLPYAIQLYSVRDAFARDPLDTFRKLKVGGYDHVELFNVGPADAPAYRRMLDDAGVKAVSAHIPYDVVTGEVQSVIDAAGTLGTEYVVIPWLDLKKAPKWFEAAGRMDEVGEQFRRADLRLGYHNHDHEFQLFDGKTAFDIIFESSKPENLFCQLDVFWAAHAGADPVRLIRDFGARCPLVHLKEGSAGGACMFAEIGSGTTDWPPIFDACADAGVAWYIVEQDESERDPLESAAISAAYLQSQ